MNLYNSINFQNSMNFKYSTHSFKFPDTINSLNVHEVDYSSIFKNFYKCF